MRLILCLTLALTACGGEGESRQELWSCECLDNPALPDVAYEVCQDEDDPPPVCDAAECGDEECIDEVVECGDCRCIGSASGAGC